MKQFVLLLIIFGCSWGVQAQSALLLTSPHALLASGATLTTEDPTQIRIYPNPATEYIGLQNGASVQRVRIVNLLGRTVKEFEAEADKQYRIADLPRGNYLVQLVDNQQKILTTKRLSKQ